MLNSEQIEHALLEAGLQLVVKNVHAHGYGSQGRLPIIFVKVRSTRAGPAAMDRAPLVIHPDYSGALDGIEGVEAAEGSYFNTNLKGFPRAVNKGQQRTAFGQAFDVIDKSTLFECLRALEVEALPSEELQQLADAARQSLESDPLYRAAEPTVRTALVNARIGQGRYRRDLLEVWGHRCSVTGCAVEKALIASHAMPWAASSNEQRLDRYNGLLLTASIDKLFDQGLISFTAEGDLLRKPDMSDVDLGYLGLQSSARLRFVDPRHQPYLSAHREKFGF